VAMGAEASTSRNAYAADPDGGEDAPVSKHPRGARLFLFQEEKWVLVGAEVRGVACPAHAQSTRTGIPHTPHGPLTRAASGWKPRGVGWAEPTGATVGRQVIPELERSEDEEDRKDGWYVEVRSIRLVEGLGASGGLAADSGWSCEHFARALEG
jgi:hypothetical protein